jgi:2Fe-2S ferredoxin
VVDALEESGLRGDALLAACRQMAGRWEVGEDEGLEALAGSVDQLIKQRSGKRVLKITVIPPNAWHSQEGQENLQETNEDRDNMMKRAFQVEALEGTSLTDVAKFGTGKGASTLGEYLECACSGIMACSTCHVVIEPGQWFQKVGEPSEAEQDMLDLAYSPRDTSRLGCQVVLTPKMDGLVIRLPSGANNLMDFVPFDD